MSVSEKDKEIIRAHAELDKTTALSEQKLQYITNKLKETEERAEVLSNDYLIGKKKLDEKDKLILVNHL